jgi:hypothetical protein
MGEYIPGPGQGADKLPGMGGVYNTINLHAYHYAGNNPVKLTDQYGRELDFDDIMEGTTLAINLYKNQTEDNLLKLNEFIAKKPEFLLFAGSVGGLGALTNKYLDKLNNSLKEKGIDIAGLKIQMDFSKSAKLTIKFDGTESGQEATLKTDSILQMEIGQNKDVLLNTSINLAIPLDSGPVNIFGRRPDLTRVTPINFSAGIMIRVKF